jgi:hypothetical protein
MSNVQVMHFLNGEDVIGDVKEPADLMDDFGTITIDNACVIVLMPDTNNPDRVGVQFRPWCPFNAGTSVKVSRSHIVYIAEPVVDLLNQYQRLFGTGLVIAGAGDVPKTGATVHRIK